MANTENGFETPPFRLSDFDECKSVGVRIRSQRSGIDYGVWDGRGNTAVQRGQYALGRMLQFMGIEAACHGDCVISITDTEVIIKGGKWDLCFPENAEEKYAISINFEEIFPGLAAKSNTGKEILVTGHELSHVPDWVSATI